MPARSMRRKESCIIVEKVEEGYEERKEVNAWREEV